MQFNNILLSTNEHYSSKIRSYGCSFKGVDWGSEKGQILRFEQIIKFIDIKRISSITDYGCGYGALYDLLCENGFCGKYQGYDISKEMIGKAIQFNKIMNNHAIFTSNPESLKKYDYTIASGVFNVKLNTSDKEWFAYTLYTLKHIARISGRGFVFNMLDCCTPYELREKDLFYAAPDFMAEYCKKSFSGDVKISKDYSLPDFTVFVNLKST